MPLSQTTDDYYLCLELILDCDSGGGAKPKAETLTSPEERAENYGKESTLPLLLHNPHTHPHKGKILTINTHTVFKSLFIISKESVRACVCAGILKKKPLSPIAERNGIHRIHNQLSISPSGSTSSRGPGTSIGSSPSQGRGGGATQVRPNEAPTSVRTGARDSDSSGSE